METCTVPLRAQDQPADDDRALSAVGLRRRHRRRAEARVVEPLDERRDGARLPAVVRPRARRAERPRRLRRRATSLLHLDRNDCWLKPVLVRSAFFMGVCLWLPYMLFMHDAGEELPPVEARGQRVEAGRDVAAGSIGGRRKHRSIVQ